MQHFLKNKIAYVNVIIFLVKPSALFFVANKDSSVTFYSLCLALNMFCQSNLILSVKLKIALSTSFLGWLPTTVPSLAHFTLSPPLHSFKVKNLPALPALSLAVHLQQSLAPTSGKGRRGAMHCMSKAVGNHNSFCSSIINHFLKINSNIDCLFL